MTRSSRAWRRPARKNRAGTLPGRISRRLQDRSIQFFGVIAASTGFSIGTMDLFDGIDRIYTLAGPTAIAVVGILGMWLTTRRHERSWVRGMEAEREVGDIIELALTRADCAWAHDISDALGIPGNIDHVVLSPQRLWVIDTKAGRVPKGRFDEALDTTLRRTAFVDEYLKRRGLAGHKPVRPALVIAHPANRFLKKTYNRNGATIHVLGTTMFLNALREECMDADRQWPRPNTNPDLVRTVWALGSTAA